jgi:hypothetical protein
MILEDYTKKELVGIVRNYKMNTTGFLRGFNTMKKSELITKLRNHPNFNIKEYKTTKRDVKFKANKIKGKLK